MRARAWLQSRAVGIPRAAETRFSGGLAALSMNAPKEWNSAAVGTPLRSAARSDDIIMQSTITASGARAAMSAATSRARAASVPIRDRARSCPLRPTARVMSWSASASRGSTGMPAADAR